MIDNPYNGMLKIPDRVPGSLTGSEFALSIESLPLGGARELAILTQILAGNVPSWLGTGLPVSVTFQDHYGVFWALPDYLAVGTDADFVRCPMNPLTAQTICDGFGATLPTRRMVDAIWKRAVTKLEPTPLPPGPSMTSTDYFVQHNAAIEKELNQNAITDITAGHKKDVVLCKDLKVGRVAIYGWHKRSGVPIQPLNAVSHDDHYADYSHGVRLVSREMYVDDKMYMNIDDVLTSRDLAGLLSDEGPITHTRYGIP